MLKFIKKILLSIKYFYAKLVVPEGPYCYKRIKMIFDQNGMPISKIKTCSFWKRDKRDPNKQMGYCSLLKIGDLDDDCSGLLFDKIKECDINDNWDDSYYE